MTKIQEKLFELQDLNYQAFSRKLNPTNDPDSIIGVRVPQIRDLAKKLDQQSKEDFLSNPKHYYFEENQLHAFLISYLKDPKQIKGYLEAFLPYTDNWTLSDTMDPKAFYKKEPKLFLECLRTYLKSSHLYTKRFAIVNFMRYYLKTDFEQSDFNNIASIKSEEYYLKMVIAWYLATAMIDHKDLVVSLLENKKLSPWIHNKTISKSIESYRIEDSTKDYLRTLRIK